MEGPGLEPGRSGVWTVRVGNVINDVGRTGVRCCTSKVDEFKAPSVIAL